MYEYMMIIIVIGCLFRYFNEQKTVTGRKVEPNFDKRILNFLFLIKGWSKKVFHKWQSLTKILKRFLSILNLVPNSCFYRYNLQHDCAIFENSTDWEWRVESRKDSRTVMCERNAFNFILSKWSKCSLISDFWSCGQSPLIKLPDLTTPSQWRNLELLVIGSTTSNGTEKSIYRIYRIYP